MSEGCIIILWPLLTQLEKTGGETEPLSIQNFLTKQLDR